MVEKNWSNCSYKRPNRRALWTNGPKEKFITKQNTRLTSLSILHRCIQFKSFFFVCLQNTCSLVTAAICIEPLSKLDVYTHADYIIYLQFITFTSNFKRI